MSGDYKYDIQLIAEDIAVDKFGLDFYELSDSRQYEVYTEAERQYFDRAADRADYMRKAARESC